MPFPTVPVLLGSGVVALLALMSGKKGQAPAPAPMPIPPGPEPQPGPAPEPPPRPGVDTATVIGDGVRLRSAPSTSGGILRTMGKGTRVNLLDAPFVPQNAGETYAWWNVELADGTQGWAYSQFISLSGGAVPKDEEEKHRREAERERPIFQGTNVGQHMRGGHGRNFVRRRSFTSFPWFNPLGGASAWGGYPYGYGGYNFATAQPRVRCLNIGGCTLVTAPNGGGVVSGVLPQDAVADVLQSVQGFSLVRFQDRNTGRVLQGWAASDGLAPV